MTMTQSAIARIEPDTFRAYDPVRFTVEVEPGRPLGAGSTIECQLPNSFTNRDLSPSRVKEWQTASQVDAHYVHVTGTGDAQIEAEIRQREFVGGYEVFSRHGRCVVATVTNGTVPQDGDVRFEFSNTTAPWLANQAPGTTDHEGLVHVAVDGEPLARLPSFRVLPREARYCRLIVPSSMTPGGSVRVLLVSLDEFSNCSASRFEGVTVWLDGSELVGDVTFTGRCELTLHPELPPDPHRAHRLVAELPGFGRVTSNPFKVSADLEGPFWGDIHIHNYPSVDAMGNTPYVYAREVSGLDFAATAEHGAGGLPAHWQQTRRWAQEADDPGRFATILGIETNMRPSFHSHINIYLYEEAPEEIPARLNGDSTVDVEAFEAYVRDKKVLSQVHHTGWAFDMRVQYHETTKLFEVYSMHGTSEHYDPESSILMDRNRNRPGDAHLGPFYLRDALALGQRFGVQGSSDNHFGQGGVRFNSVTAVWCQVVERGALRRIAFRGRRPGGRAGEGVLDDGVRTQGDWRDGLPEDPRPASDLQPRRVLRARQAVRADTGAVSAGRQDGAPVPGRVRLEQPHLGAGRLSRPGPMIQ